MASLIAYQYFFCVNSSIVAAMAQSTRDAAYSWKGPWLVDLQDLRALDRAISEAKAHVTASQHEYDEAKIRAVAESASKGRKESEPVEVFSRRLDEAEKRVRAGYIVDPLETVIEFELSSGRALRYGTIREGLINSEINSALTQRLAVSLEATRRRLWLTIDVKEEQVCINAYPAGDAHLEIAFGILKKWAVDRQPSKYYRLWGRSPLNVILLTLTGGALIGGYRATHQSDVTLQGWAALAVMGTLLAGVCLLLIGRPASSIGVGNSRHVPSIRKRWVRFCTFAVPFLFLVCVVVVCWIREVSPHQ